MGWEGGGGEIEKKNVSENNTSIFLYVLMKYDVEISQK